MSNNNRDEYRKLEGVEVFIKDDNSTMVIIGTPNPEPSDEEAEDVHNCDVMGCNSLEHVLVWATVKRVGF